MYMCVYITSRDQARHGRVADRARRYLLRAPDSIFTHIHIYTHRYTYVILHVLSLSLLLVYAYTYIHIIA